MQPSKQSNIVQREKCKHFFSRPFDACATTQGFICVYMLISKRWQTHAKDRGTPEHDCLLSMRNGILICITCPGIFVWYYFSTFVLFLDNGFCYTSWDQGLTDSNPLSYVSMIATVIIIQKIHSNWHPTCVSTRKRAFQNGRAIKWNCLSRCAPKRCQLWLLLSFAPCRFAREIGMLWYIDF